MNQMDDRNSPHAPAQDNSLAQSAESTSGPVNDGIDRRNFLSCMAWAGTGLIWSVVGGVPTSKLFAAAPEKHAPAASFSFVQISDSHIGFSKDPNLDPASTLTEAVDKIPTLRKMLGVRSVNYVPGKAELAVVDTRLSV